ncbi:hypothetical protein NW755_012625 [Fusarium falciforme]|uniref:CCHC-type domain-containing protein n=1 Tax=Fusarium falciforme TaxID=195108 RepID=A0A9W8QXH9_9HYPO|nr:hypothetical protein NW755_012625 [Fusarium falciforme]
MPRNNYGRSFGDRPGYRPPNRILDARDAAAERRREAQPPTEDPPRGNQQASNASGRAFEPASSSSRGDGSASGGNSHQDGSASRNGGHRGGSAPHGNNHGGSRPPQRHHGHGRPHDAHDRRQDKVARRPKVTFVPEIEVTKFVSEQGKTVAVRAVNRSLGGGHQDNIAAPNDRGGFVVVGNNPGPTNQIINMGMANGASAYVATIDFVYDNDVAKARKNRQLEKVVESSSGRQGPRPRLPKGTFGEGRPLAERVTEPEAEPEAAPVVEPASDPQPEPEPSSEPEGRVVDMGNMGQYQCENCGGSGHNMDRCLKVPEGRLRGCTMCHSTTHCGDDCRNFHELTLQQKVKLLVYDRFSLPPLETKVNWFKWLRQWLSHPDSRDQDRSADVPSGFPWSEKFTVNLSLGQMPGVAVDALQAEFDGHQDVARLPKDPATADFDAVHRTYGEGHIYPDQPSTLRRAKDGRFGQPAPVKEAGASTEEVANKPPTEESVPRKAYFDFDIDMDTSAN